MSHSYVHAESSAKIFGGTPEDYIQIHAWFDATKAFCPDWRHRALRHHAEGIQESIKIFGQNITNSEGKEVSVLDIGIQHQVEDFGFVPTASDWFECFDEESWKELKKRKIEERMKLPKTINEKKPSSLLRVLKSI